MIWSPTEKAYALEVYFETGSFVLARAKLMRKIGSKKNILSKKVFYGWVKSFREYGTLIKRNSFARGRSSYPKRKRTDVLVHAVQESVQGQPKLSVRRRRSVLSFQGNVLSYGTLLTILKEDLSMHPYRIQLKHKITPQNQTARVRMCRWFQQRIEEEPDWLDNVWFSDESHFHLSGNINSKSCIFWGTSPPDEVYEIPLHSPKSTAFVAMSSKGLVGPFWFESQDGETETVNKERYVDVLRQFLTELRARQGVNLRQSSFQQDGATPHTSNLALTFLRDVFGDRLISKRALHEWAPYSPDLNPLDFFLWGYLKDRVYANTPTTLEELKTSVERHTQEIPLQMCQIVIANFKRRLTACIRQKGAHFEHVF